MDGSFSCGTTTQIMQDGGKLFFLMQNVSRFLNLHVQINIVGNHCNLVVSEMVKTFGGCGLGVGSGGGVE